MACNCVVIRIAPDALPEVIAAFRTFELADEFASRFADEAAVNGESGVKFEALGRYNRRRLYAAGRRGGAS